MKEHLFEEFIKELYLYFQRKTFPGVRTIKKWQTKLDHVTDDALPFISEGLQDLDNIPRNIPKAVRKYYNQFKRLNSRITIVYDEYDDPRFPIKRLYEATEIFIEKGETEFNQYCQAYHMPSQDRDRCRNKANRIFDQDPTLTRIAKLGD